MRFGDAKSPLWSSLSLYSVDKGMQVTMHPNVVWPTVLYNIEMKQGGQMFELQLKYSLSGKSCGVLTRSGTLFFLILHLTSLNVTTLLWVCP